MSARRRLPARPNIEQIKNQAKDLLRSHRSGSLEAVPRLRARLSRLSGASDAIVLAAKFSLLDAQLVVAREYGFDNWASLTAYIEAPPDQKPSLDDDERTDERRSPENAMEERLEQLVRDGRMSAGDADDIRKDPTTGVTGARIRAGGLNERELAFIDAAFTRGPMWSGICDVDRMETLLAEEPSLIETAGPYALAGAVKSSDTLPALRLLMERGVPRMAYNPFKYNVFSVAMDDGNVEGVRAVFEAGFADASDIQIPPAHSGWPGRVGVLFWGRSNLEMTGLLLDHGGDIILNEPDAGGVTPLQHVVYDFHGRRGRLDWNFPVGRLYVERGATYDLFSACGFDDVARVAELIEQEPTRANLLHANGSAPLHWAARQSSYASAKLLLKHGAEVDPVYPSLGWTPLHWATDIDVVRLLDDYGADLDAQDKKGRTALHVATYQGERGLAEQLIALGADTSLPNKSGRTALEIARLACAYLKPTKSGERRWPGPDVPLTIFEVAELPGIGMRTVRELYERHGVCSLDDVKRMADDGSLTEAKGISAKTFDGIRGTLDLAAAMETAGLPPLAIGPGGLPPMGLKAVWILYDERGARSVEDIAHMARDGSLQRSRVEG
ncbi:hypothetical protein HOI71_09820, partial [Candidatus Poribacteria bacterium]|nr:hypothetical protein [Candidatus Poribacteria bacterium]